MRDEVIALFHELADAPPASREAYYRTQNTPDSIRDEVESLLEFDRDSGAFTSHIAETAEELLYTNTEAPAGTIWGAYRVVRQLGRGGMGAVYLAERADGEVEQRVAIKVVLSGADLPAFQERFLRERRILAALNHPGIARLLDAGRNSAGQPYLVMEYIDGVSMDAYCARLDVEEVLKLFLPVCNAVSYAHRKLIIHRDLKPSNILIDAQGQPKLLDFGIARILDAPGETRTVMRIMTPEYASPEQMRGEAYSTATDVYSLGAVLFRLLTGHPPSEKNTATGHVPRDVDAILRKALRSEPEERYTTVDALGDDIRAFLENRPVRARAGNAWYRARKFLRRYWIPASAVAVAIAGLSAGLYIANRERAVAEARFSQVRDLSNQVFKLDKDIRNLPGATGARHALVTMSLQYLERLGREAHGDRDLAMEIGAAYLAVARVQGVPGNSNLGEIQAADETLGKAERTVDPLLARFGKDRTALALSAEVAHDRMILANTMRRNEQCLMYARRAAARLDTLRSLGSLNRQETELAGHLYGNIALANVNQHQLDDAIRYAREGAEIARAANHPDYISGNLSVLSNALRLRGDLEAALETTRQAVALQQGQRDNFARTNNLIVAHWREGRILGEDGEISLNRPQEAAVEFQTAYDLADQLVRRDAADYASRSRFIAAAQDLGNVLRHTDPARALEVYDQGLERSAEIQNAESRHDRVRLLAASSYPLRALHRVPEAKQRIDAAFDLLRDLKVWPAAAIQPSDAALDALRALGDYQAETGGVESAIGTYRELLDKMRASKAAPETDLRDANSFSLVEQRLAELERKAGRSADADALDRGRQELWERWDQKRPNNSFIRRQLTAGS